MNRRLGPYQLVQRLGTGGMAEVYLAHAKRRGNVVQPCVVKLLHEELARDDDFTDMLIEEARLVARLRHNNIAGLYDVDRQDGELFLVMEYVDGRDLHSILARATGQGKKLPLPFAAYVARGLCAGLHFAHTRRGPDGTPLHLVHRDVSPPNILVSALGEVKLIDFGIAKFNSQAREKTRSGVIKGKFGYMSPEHAWNEELDHRSDLFSVGVCLYEMLTGRSLYGQSDDPMTMLRRAREADIEPVTRWRDMPDSLATVVHCALESNRDDRYPTAHHMERQLAIVLGELAPDYTGLDAGALVDELFDTDEPALDELSPRIGGHPHSSFQSGDPSPSEQGNENTGRHSDDTTSPMTDVPHQVTKSGRYLQSQSVDRPGENSSTDPPREKPSRNARDKTAQTDSREQTNDADEPTAKLVFSDDNMELFGDLHTSGPPSASSRERVDRRAVPASRRPDRSVGRNPRESTQIIDDHSQRDDSSPDPGSRIDDTATDPIRDTALVSRQSNHSSPSPDHQSPRRSGAQQVPAPDKSEPTGGLHEELDSPLSPEKRPPIAATGALPSLSEPAHDSKEPSPSDEDSAPFGLDRRVQIALATAFVAIALIYVLSRLLA